MNINTQVNNTPYSQPIITEKENDLLPKEKEVKTESSPLTDTVTISPEGLTLMNEKEDLMNQTFSGTGTPPPPER